MEAESSKRKRTIDRKKEADVSDEEMAKKWKTMRQDVIIGEKIKHNKGSRTKYIKREEDNISDDEPTGKRPKFLRPQD